MKPDFSASDPTPPDCFRLEELEQFQSFEGRVLADVNYYVWLNKQADAAAPRRFLYALELIFDDHGALLLSSGEDSEAIVLISPEALIKTARQLQTLHGEVTVQRIRAGAFPLWQPACGQVLEGIRLSGNEQGLYLNDALVLDFGTARILVQLSPKEGLEIGPF